MALERVEVRFGPIRALAGLSLEVAAGERVAVIGASGAGKSTLFDVLTRSIAPEAGRVAVHGQDILALPRRDLRRLRRRIGMVYQSYGLVPQLSVGMNVALGEVAELSSGESLRMLLRGPRRATSERVLAALDRVGLADRLADRVAGLSGGQQQRVAVARALVQGADLLLADEPIGAVDHVTGARVMSALLEAAEGRTLIASLHDVALARRFPRVVALREGRVVFDGAPDDLDDTLVRRIYAGDTSGATPDGGPGRATGAAGAAGEDGAAGERPLDRPAAAERHCSAGELALPLDREGYGLRAR